MFRISWCDAYELIASRSGIEPTLPALEGEVLTTGPPGKSLQQGFDLAKQTWSWKSEQAPGWRNRVVLAQQWEADKGVA